MNLIDIKVPDIGDFSDVPVIELYVKPGDAIAVDDAIAMLESDKATMDVPSTAAGIVREVCVKLGDRVGEGSLLIRVEAADTASAPAQPQPAASAAAGANGQSPLQQQTPPQESAPAVADVKVPDIGDFTDVPVIELYVKPGDAIAVDNAIAMLESDKATMDVPSTVAGIVQEVCVKLGDKVSEGSLLIRVETVGTTSTEATPSPNSVRPEPVEGKNGVMTQNLPEPSAVHASTSSARTEEALSVAPPSLSLGGLVHASPSVRAYARELGADLARIAPTGPKGRILKEDVTAFVKRSLQNPVAAAPASLGGGLDLLPWPQVDFAKFGEIEKRPLSRIQKISAQNLSRNWVMIPAVTYHEEADITDLEAFRVQVNAENAKAGEPKLTLLAFLVAAVVKALKVYPAFNSSLMGEELVLKKYFNIGFAADTPQGLVVPVIKNADQKSLLQLAEEAGTLARQARDGKLKLADMQGAGFTISSLGGIGGTAFSPIINAPEVAILGVNKSAMKPVWDEKAAAFVPRLTVPLSLTADHRVVDGALATRFNVFLAQLLADFRRVML